MVHPYLKNSLILSRFINAWDSSITIKIAHTLGNWGRGSFLYSAFKKAAIKNPTYYYSWTFKAIKFLAKKADMLAGLVHDQVSAAFGASITGKLCKAFAAESRSNPCGVFAAALSSFSAGYTSVVAIKGLWSVRNVLIILATALAGLLLVAIEGRWKAWISNSAVIRIWKYIVD